MHFVRRRRLYAEITFDADLIMPRQEWTACDNCDSILVDEISTQLLESLACASLLEQPGGITERVIADQKRQLLVDVLKLEEACKEKPDLRLNHISASNYYYKPCEHMDTRNSPCSVKLRIFSFKKESLKDLSLRIAQWEVFSKAERDIWAALTVRHYDPNSNSIVIKLVVESCDLFCVPCDNVDAM